MKKEKVNTVLFFHDAAVSLHIFVKHLWQTVVNDVYRPDARLYLTQKEMLFIVFVFLCL